jgi:hypothetical protein
MQHGYEPSRITNLTLQSRWAVDALDAIVSRDPAAQDAMAALVDLKAVITDGFIPSTTAVGVIDPLGSGHATMDWLQIHNLEPTASSPHERWMDQQYPSAPSLPMTDDELLGELIDIGKNLPFAARSNPDHPYWNDFDTLAEQVAERSIDGGTGRVTPFGQLLVDNVWKLPALPIAIATVDFDPGFSAEVLAMVFDPDLTRSGEVHRLEAFGVDLILMTLLDHPDALSELLQRDAAAVDAGDVLLEDTLLFQLLNSDVVGQELLGEVISAILDPSGPVDLADIERSFSLFVQAANVTEFERGFSEPVSLALALALVDLLPQLERQIRLDQPIYFDEIGGDEAIFVGEYADVRDFIGAILLSPSGLILLFALGADARDIVFDDGSKIDVQAFAELLRNAFKENLAEIDIAHAQTKTQWSLLATAVAAAVGLGPVGRSLGSTGIKIAESLIKRFGSAAAAATSGSVEGEDVGYLAQIMILFGSYESFLDDHDARDRGDSSTARQKLAEAWEQFEAGKPLGRVAETLGDVADGIKALGGIDFIEEDVADAIHDIDPIPADPDLG